MDDRKKQKALNRSEYKRLNRIIRVKVKEAKEKWLETKCSENLRLKHDSFNLHKKVKELTSTNKKYAIHSMLEDDGKFVDSTDAKLKE